MMAKMFYTMEETQAALGKNEEEVKQLAREGRLREFRDGPRLMFKSDQVDQLRAELGGGGPAVDQIDLGPSDSGAPIGLVESRGASGTSITLTDTDAGGSTPKDDTALAADLGLAGSMGGSMPGRGESRAGRTHSGSVINVFGTEEEEADPMAQTAISPGAQEQINLEGVGSGSGLLDLTRESDDTSLGAELLDEIAPGERAGGSDIGTGAMAGIEEPRGGVTRGVGAPVFVEAYDPGATALGAMSLGAALFMLIGAIAVVSAVVGTRPRIIEMLAEQNLLVLAGIGLVIAAIFAVVGLVVGKSGASSPNR
jgi:hypothetical protein